MRRCGFIKLLRKIANWSFCLIFISHVIWFQVAWIQAIWNALVTCWFEIFLQVSSEMKNVLIILDLKEAIATSNVILFLISCSDIGSLNQVDIFRTIRSLYWANHQHFKSLSCPSLSTGNCSNKVLHTAKQLRYILQSDSSLDSFCYWFFKRFLIRLQYLSLLQAFH